ncbi:MAG: stage II sporulation protein M [Candidatus Aenigmatarchaeota archaeon]
MYEKLLTKIRRKYLFIFVLTFFSILFSSLIVRNSGEVSGILVLTFAMIPLIEIINKFLEKEIIHVEATEDKNIFIRHKEFIFCYFSIFFSSILAFYISYILFPDIFIQQVKAIEQLREEVLIYAYSFRKDAFFSFILINNLKVAFMFFVFSIIFGAGSVYLLLWNSSIIGIFLGISAEKYTNGIFSKYIIYPLISFIKLLPHGILEFLGFFFASLAGGILILSFIKVNNLKEAQQYISDSILLLLFSIVFIVLGAFIEAFL